MRKDLLLECAWILPRTNNSNLKFVCEGYMDHAYDLYKQNHSNLNRNEFFNELINLAEEYDEEKDPDKSNFNSDRNKEIKEYDETSRIPKKERERLKREYIQRSKKPWNRIKDEISSIF